MDYMDYDPILIHRLWQLGEWLEVDKESIEVLDEQQHILSHDHCQYKVLAEFEIQELLSKIRKRLDGFRPKFLTQYMLLPAARRRIMKALCIDQDDLDYGALRLLLTEEETLIDDAIEKGDPKVAHSLAENDEEERPERFFIYCISKQPR